MQLTAKDVMNPDVLSLRADMTVREAAVFLTGHQIAGAPVLDAKGHLEGVLSLTDLTILFRTTFAVLRLNEAC